MEIINHKMSRYRSPVIKDKEKVHTKRYKLRSRKTKSCTNKIASEKVLLLTKQQLILKKASQMLKQRYNDKQTKYNRRENTRYKYICHGKVEVLDVHVNKLHGHRHQK